MQTAFVWIVSVPIQMNAHRDTSRKQSHISARCGNGTQRKGHMDRDYSRTNGRTWMVVTCWSCPLVLHACLEAQQIGRYVPEQTSGTACIFQNHTTVRAQYSKCALYHTKLPSVSFLSSNSVHGLFVIKYVWTHLCMARLLCGSPGCDLPRVYHRTGGGSGLNPPKVRNQCS